MDTLHEYVRQFMEAGGQPTRDYPGVPPLEVIELGINLIEEEYRKELLPAIHKTVAHPTPENLAEVADAIVDLLYVVTWNGLAWGFPTPKIMDEVQRANMAKFGPGSWKDETGKVRKPPDWKSPDVLRIIADSILSAVQRAQREKERQQRIVHAEVGVNSIGTCAFCGYHGPGPMHECNPKDKEK